MIAGTVGDEFDSVVGVVPCEREQTGDAVRRSMREAEDGVGGIHRRVREVEVVVIQSCDRGGRAGVFDGASGSIQCTFAVHHKRCAGVAESGGVGARAECGGVACVYRSDGEEI